MGQVHSPTLRNWISRGWNTYTEKAGILAGGAVILFLFFRLFELVRLAPYGFPILFLVHLVSAPILAAGWLHLCLRAIRDDDARSWDILRGFSRFNAVWETGVSVFAVWLIGTILFVVPGIILYLKYCLSLFAIMDPDISAEKGWNMGLVYVKPRAMERQLTAREALRFSGRITKGHKRKLLAVLALQLLLQLVTWPFSFGLYYWGNSLSTMLVSVGLIPYVAYFLVISPWLGATYAAAYDSLASGRLPPNPQETSTRQDGLT